MRDRGRLHRPGRRRWPAAAPTPVRCSSPLKPLVAARRHRGGAWPGCAASYPPCRRAAVPDADPGLPASAAGRATPPTSTRCRPRVQRELYEWAPKLPQRWSTIRCCATSTPTSSRRAWKPISSIDRPTASRLGITASEIDNTLYDAFGQRQVSTIYSAQNQYHVVMEVAPQYWQSPETLKRHLGQHPGRIGHRHADRPTPWSAPLAPKTETQPRRPPRRIASSSARNASTNAHCQQRQRQSPRRARRSAPRGNDGAAGSVHALRIWQHAAGGEPSGTVRRQHDFLQSRAGQIAQRRRGGDRRRRCGRSACRLRSTAPSRAPRRHSSNQLERCRS